MYAEYLRQEAERKRGTAHAFFWFGAAQLAIALLYFYLATRGP